MAVADILIRAFTDAGGDTMFGVPGGGPNLELIGAAESAGVRFVLNHGETAGVISAATYGLLSGRPGMSIATRGPGVASAVNGAAQATLDRFPVLVVTDCVPTADAERVAHQRIDQRALMAPVTKWSGRLGDDAHAGTVAAAAVRLCTSAPLGAVHLDFDPAATSDRPPGPPAPAAIDPQAVVEATRLLAAAHRPVAIVGLGAIREATAVRDAVERIGCPVLTTYQAAGVLPDGHRQLAGLYTSGAIEGDLLRRADLVIAIGLDTVEPMPAPWRYDAPLITIDSGPPPSTFLPATVALRGDLTQLLLGLTARSSEWEADAGAGVLAGVRDQLVATSAAGFGPIDLASAVARCTPDSATATVDAGADFLAIMPFWPTPAPLRLLISNGLATMGFAVPAAIGAALARPGAPVVCMVGDGGLGMTLAELETIARLQLPITVVVFDDATLSLIEIKQQPGQGGSMAVRYRPIDFAAVAAAMGLDAVVATSVADVEHALARGWDRPRLVDARIDPTTYSGLIKATRG